MVYQFASYDTPSGDKEYKYADALDDEKDPKQNVSVANFWVKFDPQRYKTKGEDRAWFDWHYTGDRNLVFDPTRPYGLLPDQFHYNGALLLPNTPNTFYAIGQHDQQGRYERHLIVSQAGETGDVAHVAAALALDPFTDVVVLTTPDQRALADDAVGTYRNAVRAYQPHAENNYERLCDQSERIRIWSVAEARHLGAIYRGLLRSKDDPNFKPLGASTWRSDGIKPVFKAVEVVRVTLYSLFHFSHRIVGRLLTGTIETLTRDALSILQ